MEATASIGVDDRVSQRVVERAGFLPDGEIDANHVRYLLRSTH
jgi:hypothetical protein